MSPLLKTETDYDTLLRPVTTRLMSGASILSLRQAGYDSRGRMECEALRMNAAAFGSPPSSACAPGTAGAHGPDRISKFIFNAGGQLTEITGAFGTAEAGPDVRYTYTDNGLQATVQDEKGNLTTYVPDGFDRAARVRYPDPATLGTSSATDYDECTYNSVGRLTTRTPPAGQPAVTYAYDLLGRMTSASHTGHTVDTRLRPRLRGICSCAQQRTASPARRQ